MDHMEEVKELRACTVRHYNCAQSVLVPFSDVTGLTKEQSDRLGSLFGSGMNHGGECGTLTAASMVLGMAGYGREEQTRLLRAFREKHEATCCRDLLASSAARGEVKKTHCDSLVFEVTGYLDEILGQDKPL